MPSPPKYLYDFELAEGSMELREILESINLNRYKIISVTQTGLLYTVVFQRPARE